MNKKKLSLILSGLMLIGTIIPLVFADATIDNVRFTAVGKISIVADGVGLKFVDSGDISITVPGTVIAAFLYWSGYDLITGGDDEVLFDGNTVTADGQFGPDFWLHRGVGPEDDMFHFVYVADVTGQVNTGTDTYTVDGFELDTEYGAGLMVVYEDASLPMARVTILDGLDSYWFGFESPRGPNSEVFGLDFDAYSSTRDVEMILFAGGCSGPDDPNKVLTQTGDGAKPTTLVVTPSVAPWSLTANDGEAWDTYETTVTVAADDEWLSVQVESVGTDGTSGLVAGAGFVLPVYGGGKVTGGGQIKLGEGKKDVGSFGFNAMWFSKDPGPKGELEYLDHVTGNNYHAHIVEYLIVWEPKEGNKPGINSKAIFNGPCTINHESGFRFQVYVEDNCEPGVNDVFKITIWDNTDNIIYSEGSNIISGNIQIHKPPK